MRVCVSQKIAKGVEKIAHVRRNLPNVRRTVTSGSGGFQKMAKLNNLSYGVHICCWVHPARLCTLFRIFTLARESACVWRSPLNRSTAPVSETRIVGKILFVGDTCNLTYGSLLDCTRTSLLCSSRPLENHRLARASFENQHENK